MTNRRQVQFLSGLIAVILLIQPAYGTTDPHLVENHETPLTPIFEPTKLRLSFFDYPEPTTFVDQVSMTRLPPGSLRVEYRGLHKPIMRYAHRQFRKYWNKQIYTRTEFMLDHEQRAHWEDQGWAWADFAAGGQWWTRSWMDSLTPEHGGAPTVPVVHTVGQDAEWKFGPLTVSNTLKAKFDYVAVLNIDSDPDTPQVDPTKLPRRGSRTPIVVDVHTPEDFSYGTRVKFKVRPHIRVGIPKHADWMSLLRGASLRAEAQIYVGGQPVLNIQAEVKYKPLMNVVATIDIAFVAW